MYLSFDDTKYSSQCPDCKTIYRGENPCWRKPERNPGVFWFFFALVHMYAASFWYESWCLFGLLFLRDIQVLFVSELMYVQSKTQYSYNTYLCIRGPLCLSPISRRAVCILLAIKPWSVSSAWNKLPPKIKSPAKVMRCGREGEREGLDTLGQKRILKMKRFMLR